MKTCPTDLTFYKNKLEGPFYSNDEIQFDVNRTISYKCEYNQVKFQTERHLLEPQITGYNYQTFSGFGECTGICNNTNVTVTVTYKNCFFFATS